MGRGKKKKQVIMGFYEITCVKVQSFTQKKKKSIIVRINKQGSLVYTLGRKIQSFFNCIYMGHITQGKKKKRGKQQLVIPTTRHNASCSSLSLFLGPKRVIV